MRCSGEKTIGCNVLKNWEANDAKIHEPIPYHF